MSRPAYANRLQGFWLGQSIGNWSEGANMEFGSAAPGSVWGASDNTDLKYRYQHQMLTSGASVLSGAQIRDCCPENASLSGGRLSTELFGLLAPGRPDVALRLADMSIRATAHGEARWAAQFYVVMHSLAAVVDTSLSRPDQVYWLASRGRQYLPETSHTAEMYDFVRGQHDAGEHWQDVCDALYADGGFAGETDFAASLLSLFYGGGDLQDTIRLATLTGWKSDNPATTWGGLLGFLYGKQGIERAFGHGFADKFRLHRTQGGFPGEDVDTFTSMAATGLAIVDQVVWDEMGGQVDLEWGLWLIPEPGHPVIAGN